MKQGDKDLKDILLKDLSSRLPYGVKCQVQEDQYTYTGTLCRIEVDDKNGHLLDFAETISGLDCQVYLSEVKPYLFPLSSMTKEDIESLFATMYDVNIEIKVNPTEDKNFYEIVISNGYCTNYFYSDALLDNIDYIGYDWLNKHHFDYRGLVPMGLAKDCTNLNIY